MHLSPQIFPQPECFLPESACKRWAVAADQAAIPTPIALEALPADPSLLEAVEEKVAMAARSPLTSAVKFRQPVFNLPLCLWQASVAAAAAADPATAAASREASAAAWQLGEPQGMAVPVRPSAAHSLVPC